MEKLRDLLTEIWKSLLALLHRQTLAIFSFSFLHNGKLRILDLPLEGTSVQQQSSFMLLYPINMVKNGGEWLRMSLNVQIHNWPVYMLWNIKNELILCTSAQGWDADFSLLLFHTCPVIVSTEFPTFSSTASPTAPRPLPSVNTQHVLTFCLSLA